MISLTIGRINVVFKFWNQFGWFGILKLNHLILEKMLIFLQKNPLFANVYKVKVRKQANQSVLKCDCLHYERCGILCTHILKITNQIEETMITVQY
jgi:hypothetical protein